MHFAQDSEENRDFLFRMECFMPVLVGFLDNVNGGVKFGYQQNGTSREAEKLDTEEAGGGRKIERGFSASRSVKWNLRERNSLSTRERRHWVWFRRWTHLLESLGKMKETLEKGKRAKRGDRN
ncbi:hypothetical protein HKD37_01G001960 [Glycine soja]|nr:hypothetical protein JHK87_001729 [Glycine soja]